jgi:general secretion pathway protein G
VVKRAEETRLRKHRTQSGFTLVELTIVLAIIGILLLLAIPRFTGAIRSAREAALREDLQTMRTGIDTYTMDKQKGPQSLDDLVQDGYLKTIPEDPITRSKDTWVTDSSEAMYSLDETEPGITNVHSGSTDIGSDGQPYSSW